ncbi:hypothetical protein GGH93_003102 [Coemansia aciculifera]|nr:hypothetical protein GGH93_003102 [Coemansia aciculifera]
MNPARAPAIRSRLALLVLAPLLAAVVLGFAASTTRRPAGDIAAAGLLSPWASKRNPLNTYVAKFAWAWTTTLFAAMLLTAIAPPRAVLRYALATLYWLAMTRWFFGPPLFDRLFVRTGGECQLSTAAPADSPYSMSACRAAGGAWAGGHDVSGHCFLLLHSGLFLAEEVLVPLLLLSSSLHPQARTASPAARWAVVAATLGLVAVWLLMLFFTAKYFHGFDELVSGSLLGVAYWFAVYRVRLLPL